MFGPANAGRLKWVVGLAGAAAAVEDADDEADEEVESLDAESSACSGRSAVESAAAASLALDSAGSDPASSLLPASLVDLAEALGWIIGMTDGSTVKMSPGFNSVLGFLT